MNLTDCIYVSVVVPVFNEIENIEQFINSVLDQDFDRNRIEVLLIDGMSSDGTRDILKKYENKFSFIKIFDNKNRSIPCALNIGIKNALGKYIVRMDAHTDYSPDYISKCISLIETGKYQNVGGPTILKWKSKKQKIIASSYYSLFALGGGKNHCENYKGLSDTVQFGTFNKEYLKKIGMYDEKIKFAEDDDLNFRILENGGKIFISPKIKFAYYPRKNFRSLFLQYFRYGMWKVYVIKKHKKPARISHLIPLCFVLFLITFSFLAFFNKFAYFFLMTIMSIYLVLCIFFSFSSSMLTSFGDKILLVWTHFVLHFSYGLGFLCGIFYV